MKHSNQTCADPWSRARSILFFFALAFSLGGMLIFWERALALILAYPDNSLTLFLVWVCALAVLMPPRANYDGG